MAPRTRSCPECRRRRMKCDATLPRCQQCQRANRTCSGVTQGALIVDMSQQASGLRQVRRRRKTPKDATLHDAAVAHYFHGWPMTVPASPSQGAIATMAFFQTFMNFFTSRNEGTSGRAWIHMLPDFISNGSRSALELAVQATAVGYCAAEARQPAALREASKLYGEALLKQAREVAGALTHSKATPEMVCTSLLLSFFEAMHNTNTNAYRNHVEGAARMMQVLHPDERSQILTSKLFHHVQAQLMFLKIGQLHGSALPLMRHRTLPITVDPTPVHERLLAILADLSDLYSVQRSASASASATLLGAAAARIDRLWLEYELEGLAAHRPVAVRSPATGAPLYRDAFTALTTSYFAESRILLLLLARDRLRQLSGPAGQGDDVLRRACRAILDCAAFLATKRIGCAYIRLASPLLLVAVRSPCPAQRREARAFFERWWSEGVMKGLSAIALADIRRAAVEVDGLDDCSSSTLAVDSAIGTP